VVVARVYGFWKSKRRGDGKEKNSFRIIIVEARGACVIAIIWLGQKVAASKMGSKDNCNGLANRLLRGRFKAKIGHVSR
jgi:hypothetical protein